jgi:serine kinase of HPr protein (carbohydrate metabolism regulator)
MEVRGIGIINVAQMFGVKAIRKDKSLDLIITLKPWNDVPDVDRLGMEQEFVKVLGRGHSARHDSRAAGPRHCPAHRSRRLPDQAAQIRLQRRRGVEQTPARADGGKGAAAARRMKCHHNF